MATTRLMPLHIGKGSSSGKVISRVIGYVGNPDKTQSGELVTGYACNPQTADMEFQLSRRIYLTTTNHAPAKNEIIAYHFRQSFAPGEISPEEANRIGRELAERFTQGNHAFIVATHTDKKHIHNHIVWNAVNIEGNRKFRNFWGSSKALRRLSDTLCLKNGLSIVENPQIRGDSYDKWQGDNRRIRQRDVLRSAIDAALATKPGALDALLKLLAEQGWEVKYGKHIALRGQGKANFLRLDSLGGGYTEADLRAVLAGERVHTPQKQSQLRPARGHISLLVDIQAKLRQGKGAGYESWAKVFNLKQMASTMNFLSEHGISSREALAAMTDTAVKRHAELSDKIKAAEKRMAEIAVLKTHIINYSKTRDVYVAYRKSGYSKKYFAAHEQEIQLHKAAKKAFDELGIEKIPTVKELQAEYAELLTEKKAAYPEYRTAREEMRELLTVKANVDRIMEPEREQRQQPDQNRGQT